MRLSRGVLQVVLAIVASGLSAGCAAKTQDSLPPPAPPPPAPTLSSAPVAITVSESGGIVRIAATPMDVEIWWNAKTGQYGEVAWSLRLDGKAGNYVDRVEVRVKPAEAPETKTLLAASYGLTSGGVTLSGPVLKDPVNASTPWAYDVVALKNGVEVARLDPRVIIRR